MLSFKNLLDANYRSVLCLSYRSFNTIKCKTMKPFLKKSMQFWFPFGIPLTTSVNLLLLVPLNPESYLKFTELKVDKDLYLDLHK